MFNIIAKLHDIADKLDDRKKYDLAKTVDKIASILIEAYKFRIKRQRRSRGITRVRRRLHYRRNRAQIRRKQKMYRRRTRIPRKRRRKLKHYRRFG